jgi:guanosine-3',5'-bis(diphosphate) 3'-pyrophosphohydrolase
MATKLGKFIKAAEFAARKHRNQRRKDEEASPYINHPIALAEVLTNIGGVDDIHVLCAAVLHDTIEDTETTLEELQREFGARIAGIVAEVTDDKSLPKKQRKELQVLHASTASPGARLVKLADKICNLRDLLTASPKGWSNARRGEYFDWAHRVVTALGDVNAPMQAEFEAVYARRHEATSRKAAARKAAATTAGPKRS